MDNKHIAEEKLAAFIDNRLIGKSRDEVLEHLLECEDCRRLSMEIAKEINEKKGIIRSISHYIAPVALAASITIVIVASLGDNSVSLTKSKDVIIKSTNDTNMSWEKKVSAWIKKQINKLIGDENEKN